jgi:hypothetical protein
MAFLHCSYSTVLALATLGDMMKFERFLFVSNHSMLPRDVDTCCCCTWFSFNAVTVLYSPWLPWETQCNLKGSYLCHIIQGCQGMYIPVAVVDSFPSLQLQCCTYLGYPGRHDAKEIFKFLSHHSRLARDVHTCRSIAYGFPSMQ